jgi:pantoate--beta-alanine ligase
MILIKQASGLSHFLSEKAGKSLSVGFVPTMGALHAGHLSLVKAAKQENDLVVCSIFVNPTQFNNPVDFAKYPITIEKDIELLESAGVDILFLPSVSEIYPSGTTHLPQYPLGYLETILEGSFRPGHFQGVCQVMHLLLELVKADNLYMGQKDYQQCMVIQRLLKITGSTTVLHTCETKREQDGLAMSSRNKRLSEKELKQARFISNVLSRIKQTVQAGPVEPIVSAAEQALRENGFKVDYVAIAAADNLEIVEEWDGQRPLVTLAAAYLNEVRLIDNMLIP